MRPGISVEWALLQFRGNGSISETRIDGGPWSSDTRWFEGALERSNVRLDARQRRKPVPRNGARRAKSVHSPIQVERFLSSVLVRLADRFASAVRAIVTPTKIDELAQWPHADAKPTAAESKAAAKLLASKMKEAADRLFNKAAVRSVVEQAARRVDAHAKDQFKKLGINPKKEPELKFLVSSWTRDVAERVKGMGGEQVKKLEAILSEGHRRHAETIANEIEEQLGVTRSQAEFIARDSIGTLNSKISRARQEAAGIAFYVWASVGDERVRDKHVELDGQVFEVDGPGDEEEGHPGEPPQCRCVAYPLAPDEGPKADDEETDE